jgi:hypothetical protein
MMISLGSFVLTLVVVADAGGAGIGMADDLGWLCANHSDRRHPKGVERFLT